MVMIETCDGYKVEFWDLTKPEKISPGWYSVFDIDSEVYRLVRHCKHNIEDDHEDVAKQVAELDCDGLGDGITEWNFKVTSWKGSTKKVCVTAETEVAYCANIKDE